MNINASTGVERIVQPVVPGVDSADNSKAKAEVAPVEKSHDSAQAELDQQALREKPEEKPTNEELAEAVKNIQSRLDVMRTQLGFVLHEETEDVIIEVTDRNSGDLIRQIPSEEVMEIRARLDELVGIIFNQKA